MSHDGDGYVEIDCTFLGNTDRAVKIAHEMIGGSCWIPRSCLHGGDDLRIKDMGEGEAVQLKIRRWKAEAEGLV